MNGIEVFRSNGRFISLLMFSSVLFIMSSCSRIKTLTEQQKVAKSGFRVLHATDSIMALEELAKIYSSDSLNVLSNKSIPSVVVLLKEEDGDFWTSTTTQIAVFAALVAFLAYLFSLRSFSLTRKAEITKEFINMNSLDIENPIVEWIYLTESGAISRKEVEANSRVVTIFGEDRVKEVMAKAKTIQDNNSGTLATDEKHILDCKENYNTDFEQIMRSYCYKYLNLFDLVNQEYKIMRWWRGLKRVRRIADNNPKRWLFWWWMERTFPRIRERREWIRFFGNNFKYVDPDVQASGVSDNNGKKKVNAQIAASWKPPTKAYLIIDDILNRSVVKRTYSNRFIRYANKLMLNKDTTPF
ncbi:MAG: hypothetical protein IPP69_12050 [Flavobacteriales bacterium]|nr:hypothetical protein [Flavobacteriales bacterium]